MTHIINLSYSVKVKFCICVTFFNFFFHKISILNSRIPTYMYSDFESQGKRGVGEGI